MYSAGGNAVLPALGFPIRESADQRLFSAYPRLIAAVHALLRLLVPRHPPSALNILTVIVSEPLRTQACAPARHGDIRSLAIAVRFSRSVKRHTRAGSSGACPTRRRDARAGLSKLDSSPAPPQGNGIRGPVDILVAPLRRSLERR